MSPGYLPFAGALEIPAWLCENCGSWQRWFERPPACALCVDSRHVLPQTGWSFLSLEEAQEKYPCVVDEPEPGILRLRNDPAPGIGPMGYVIGDVAFECCAVPSREALAALPPLRVAAASHPHSYGALHLLQDTFDCEVALHPADLRWSSALRVTWPFDEQLEVAPGLTLHLSGGHFDGHTVLHDAAREILFCGDALKFELDPEDERRALTISAHKAFVRGIPLTPGELRGYRDLFSRLSFTQTWTPFEQAANAGREEALALIDSMLATRPHAARPPGGAVSAAAAAEAYRELLVRSGAELVEFPITGLDRTGVPVHTVAAFLPGGRLRNGVGYGVDEAAAQASALGECVEVLFGTLRLPEPVAVDGTELDVRTLIPDAGAAPDGERLWVRVQRLPAGDEVLVPLEWVAHTSADLPPGYAPLITPITNGLGVHTDRELALDHCLRELVQRDGNAVSYRALDRGVGVDVELDAPAPGIRPILKAAECDLGMTNVYVVGDDEHPPHPLSVTACGEAAGPDRDQAIGKALREFAASHVRKVFNHGPLAPILALAPERYREHVAGLDVAGEEPRALEAMLGWLEKTPGELRALTARTLAVERTVRVSDLPHAPGRSTYELLVERGFDVLVCDMSPPGSGVHVLKAIVPGLEVETMSYGRCGARNLARLLERDLGLVGLGAPPAGARELHLPDGGRAWFSPRVAAEVVGDLYPLYREPARHVTALALTR